MGNIKSIKMKKQKALILIDLQNDYFEGGKNPLVHSKEAAKQAKKLLEYFRANELPVFFVQHISLNQDAKFFAPDTIGAEIYDEIFPKEQEGALILSTSIGIRFYMRMLVLYLLR